MARSLAVTGLDLSLTATGVASPDGTLRTVKPKKLKGVERLAFIECALTFPILQADLVVIEGYAFNAHGRSVFQIGELGGVIRLVCHKAHVPYIEVAPATLKKFASGKGNASKQQMMEAFLERFGEEPEDDNQCDAAFLKLYGQEEAP